MLVPTEEARFDGALAGQLRRLRAAGEVDVITDVGSALALDRPGILVLLERVLRGDVKSVVVVSADRLCSGSWESVCAVFEKHGAAVRVLEAAQSAGVDWVEEIRLLVPSPAEMARLRATAKPEVD